jgi:hypothetical protein
MVQGATVSFSCLGILLETAIVSASANLGASEEPEMGLSQCQDDGEGMLVSCLFVEGACQPHRGRVASGTVPGSDRHFENLQCNVTYFL